MDHVVRNYSVVGISVVLVTMLCQLLISTDYLNLILAAVIMLCGYLCVVLGLYMYFEGRGSKGINGIDFSQYDEQQKKNLLSYVGLYIVIASILMMIGIALIMVNIILGIVAIVVSTAFFLVPFAVKGRGVSKQFVEKGVGTKVVVFIAVSVIAIVPSIYLCNSEYAIEVVTVEFLDDQLCIKAPMVDETFDYNSIEMLGYDEHFDKGTRVWGYGTSTVCSGTFKNDVFGKYTLASYTKVEPCVFFQYEGHYYAFNQSTVEETFAAYEILNSKVNPTI